MNKVPQGIEPAFEYWLKQAGQGDAEAQYKLAGLYQTGYGIPRNLEKGIEWLRSAAEQAYAPAQLELGEIYYYGEGVDPDEESALEWIRKAAGQGYAKAQERLDELSGKHKNISLDTKAEEKTMETIRKEAVQGDAEAQYKLGMDCAYGGELNFDDEGYDARDFAPAAEWFEKAAAQGHAGALAELAKLYFYDYKGVTQSNEKALDCYRRLADLGDAESQYTLGLYYIGKLKGPNMNNDVVDAGKGVEWLEKSAKGRMGPDVDYYLGKLYQEGRVIKKDLQKAMNWYRSAAGKGSASEDAMCILGLYAEGMLKEIPNDKPDLAGAVEWYMKAANSKSAFAKHRLGVMYAKGEGVKLNQERADEWFASAAEQEYSKSDYEFDLLYYNGEIPEDKAEVIKWLKQEAKEGNAEAQEKLDDMGYGGR